MLIRLAAATCLVALASARAGKQVRMAGKRISSAACRAADSTTADEIAWWQTMMHSTSASDSLYVARVNVLYVPDSAFAAVTDSATCATALAAHNSDAGYDATELASTAASTVYVIRIGPRYVTWNPDFPSGEWVTHTVWDSNFVALEHYMH